MFAGYRRRDACEVSAPCGIVLRVGLSEDGVWEEHGVPEQLAEESDLLEAAGVLLGDLSLFFTSAEFRADAPGGIPLRCRRRCCLPLPAEFRADAGGKGIEAASQYAGELPPDRARPPIG